MSSKQSELKTIFDHVVAFPAIVVYWMLRKLPEKLTRTICRSIAVICFHAGIRRKVIDANLRIAFPEMNAEAKSHVVRDIYSNIGEFLGEWLVLPELGSKLASRVQVENGDVYQKAIDQGKGVLLCSAHLGHWEILAATIADRFEPRLSIIRHALGNARFDRWFTEVHEAMQFGDIIKGRSMLEIFKRLKRKETVGMLVDQSGRGSGIWIPFFNRPTSFHRGPGMILSKLRCPAVTVFCIPGHDGNWIIRFQELLVKLTGDIETDTYIVMSEYARQLEAVIREYPSRYFWFHKRWKTNPPKEILDKWHAGEFNR